MISLTPMTKRLLAIFAIILIGYVSAQKFAPATMGKLGVSDFEVFHLAGQLIWSGEINQAFDKQFFSELQKSIPGSLVTAERSSTMLWSYPPVYNFVVAPLGLLPAWLSYAIFMLASLGFFLLVLRRLAGPAFDTLIIAMAPLILLVIKNGQNSFLTAALVGLTCLYLLRNQTRAGLPLGLMVIKPHLALGVGLGTLLLGRWQVAVLSIATAIAAIILSALVFGTDSWHAFLGGLGTTGDALQSGQFPMHRQSSVYIFGLYWGFGHSVALVLHGLVAALFLGLLVLLSTRTLPFQALLGFTICISPLISPYTYDYDLMMVAMGLALLMPTLLANLSATEQKVLVAAAWLIGLYGMAMGLIYDPVAHATGEKTFSFPALIAPIYVTTVALIFTALIRAIRNEKAMSNAAHA